MKSLLISKSVKTAKKSTACVVNSESTRIRGCLPSEVAVSVDESIFSHLECLYRASHAVHCGHVLSILCDQFINYFLKQLLLFYTFIYNTPDSVSFSEFRKAVISTNE